MELRSMAGNCRFCSVCLPSSTCGKKTSRALVAALPLHEWMSICLDSPDVKDLRLRKVVAAVSRRNRRFFPAILMVTTGRRSQRSIGISSFLSWLWARSDPEKQARRKDKKGTREVSFMEPPLQKDRLLTSVRLRRKDLASPR